MNLEPRIDIIASALADTSRARIVCVLMDGRAFTNKELACYAGITPQTASSHLKRLTACGVIAAIQSGRRKYYRIANSGIAGTIESLAVLAPADHLKRAAVNGTSPQMLTARSCFDHVAGRLGVVLAEQFCRRGLLKQTNETYEVLDVGDAVFTSLGIHMEVLKRLSRPLTRCCLDWSERRFHLAGSLGSALFDVFLENGWLSRQRDGRALEITPVGFEAFAHHFSLSQGEINGLSEMEENSLSA